MAERGTPNPAVGGSSPPSPAEGVEFLKKVREELKKVEWPNRQLVWKATYSVIIFSLIMGIYLWLIDLIFVRLISFLLGAR